MVWQVPSPPMATWFCFAERLAEVEFEAMNTGGHFYSNSDNAAKSRSISAIVL